MLLYSFHLCISGPILDVEHKTEGTLSLLTGGCNVSQSLSVKSVEVYPRTDNCSLPDLQPRRRRHTTFLTSDSSPSIAICGGGEQGVWTSASCLVLDQANQIWNRTIMGSLTRAREDSAAVTLSHVGVFIIGGTSRKTSGRGPMAENQRTSEFLETGSMQWQAGPALPEDMAQPCALAISNTSFLVIHHNIIREFDVVTDGPISSEGWRRASTWPILKTSRAGWPGCAKLGQKVIIAGGWPWRSGYKGTEVLDLVTRQITQGGDLITPRHWFHLATIKERGIQKVFALAGKTDGEQIISTVEEWEEETSTWKVLDNLAHTRCSFGAVEVPKDVICSS